MHDLRFVFASIIVIITSPTAINQLPHLYRHHTTTLTVRLLVSGTRAGTAEFLGLASSVVGNEQGAVVLHERLLQLVLGEFIHVFLIVGNDGLGNGLTDGVDLAGVTTAGDADANVNFGEAVEAEDQEGLVDLLMNCQILLCVRAWICGF